MYVAVSSPTLPLYQVYDYADTMMAQRISMVARFVAQVQVYGSKYACACSSIPTRCHLSRIGVDEVQAAIQRGNVNLPTGTLYGTKQAFTVQSNGQLFNAAAFRPLIVAYRNGNPCGSVNWATSSTSVEKRQNISWFMGTRAIVLGIQRQPDQHDRSGGRHPPNCCRSFALQIPASSSWTSFLRSLDFDSRIDCRCQFTLLLTICLVVLVIFLFLRNVSATAIPISQCRSPSSELCRMYLLGYTVDNLSLMALTLSVGFVVDDPL